MEKFGMSFGGGPSRKELLETVESLKKQLAQYQSRFKDVVQAYKSLMKEKEALEASLKVLSTSQFADVNRCERPALLQDGARAGADAAEEDAAEGASTCGSEAGGAAAARDGQAERRELQLKAQVGTLTAALATVTQEKSRMEASFQADKRQLKQEADDLRERLAATSARQQAEVGGLQMQLAESRARVITQQHEREREQSQQLRQLQELQKVLQQERDLRQDTELRLHEANASGLAAAHAADRQVELEALLRQAGEERDELRRKLRSAREERDEADPGLELLQRELSQLKKSLQDQICNHNRKLRQEEARAHAAELRVGGLEQRVSELSDLLGSCEKARQREQQVAQRLRERMAQSDAENQTLASGGSPDDSQPDTTALKDKLEKVKELLLLAAQRNPPSEPEPDEELRRLKDELERYKLGAKAASKKSHGDGSYASRELEEAREQLADLREKYVGLRVESDKSAAAQRHALQQQQRRAAELLRRQRQEAERREATHRDELMRLEAELHKQRERTLALLDEKEREMELLRVSAPGPLSAPGVTEGEDEDEDEGERQAEGPGRAPRQGEPAPLLYAEQLARKDAETAGLRRQKRQLEDDVHRLRRKLAAGAQRHDDESRALRAQLDELIREQKREGSDVEYLKNVIYRFLTLPDAGGRRQTLNAILAILHFSPQEKQSVLRQQGAPWWSGHKR
ncbi:GRIP and coiled-coil domain-containing protein 1 [Hippocampus zosterae]|uniref:GRIP and coiled-coil domain-containing protein 1 n=1 Tax=Hippocampus zosterae TaxID=109293 RepID=UPI00223E2BF6|nr:GRIP and coiled-coil domain-containing protein 1 [Hippocampus zosterae]